MSLSFTLIYKKVFFARPFYTHRNKNKQSFLCKEYIFLKFNVLSDPEQRYLSTEPITSDHIIIIIIIATIKGLAPVLNSHMEYLLIA